MPSLQLVLGNAFGEEIVGPLVYDPRAALVRPASYSAALDASFAAAFGLMRSLSAMPALFDYPVAILRTFTGQVVSLQLAWDRDDDEVTYDDGWDLPIFLFQAAALERAQLPLPFPVGDDYLVVNPTALIETARLIAANEPQFSQAKIIPSSFDLTMHYVIAGFDSSSATQPPGPGDVRLPTATSSQSQSIDEAIDAELAAGEQQPKGSVSQKNREGRARNKPVKASRQSRSRSRSPCTLTANSRGIGSKESVLPTRSEKLTTANSQDFNKRHALQRKQAAQQRQLESATFPVNFPGGKIIDHSQAAAGLSVRRDASRIPSPRDGSKSTSRKASHPPRRSLSRSRSRSPLASLPNSRTPPRSGKLAAAGKRGHASHRKQAAQQPQPVPITMNLPASEIDQQGQDAASCSGRSLIGSKDSGLPSSRSDQLQPAVSEPTPLPVDFDFQAPKFNNNYDAIDRSAQRRKDAGKTRQILRREDRSNRQMARLNGRQQTSKHQIDASAPPPADLEMFSDSVDDHSVKIPQNPAISGTCSGESQPLQGPALPVHAANCNPPTRGDSFSAHSSGDACTRPAANVQPPPSVSAAIPCLATCGQAAGLVVSKPFDVPQFVAPPQAMELFDEPEAAAGGRSAALARAGVGLLRLMAALTARLNDDVDDGEEFTGFTTDDLRQSLVISENLASGKFETGAVCIHCNKTCKNLHGLAIHVGKMHRDLTSAQPKAIRQPRKRAPAKPKATHGPRKAAPDVAAKPEAARRLRMPAPDNALLRRSERISARAFIAVYE